MSQYGAFEGRWAPITNETETALPTYGSAVSLGELSKVTDALTFTSVTAEGDDRVVDSLDEFASGTVDVDYDPGTSNEALAAVHGATLDEDGGLAYSAEDEPPFGGYGFLVKLKHGSKTYYQCVMYPRLKAVPQGREYAGKKSSGATLVGDKIHMNLYAALNGQYKILSPEFDSDTEALAWLDAKLPKANS